MSQTTWMPRDGVSEERTDLFKTLNEDAFFHGSENLARSPTNGFLAEAYRESGHIQADSILFRERLFPKLDLKVDYSSHKLGRQKRQRRGLDK